MKLAAFILCSAFLQLNARSVSQITINEEKVSLTRIFKLVENQTDYLFWYNSVLMDKTAPVTVNVKNATLEQVMAVCLKDQPLTYSIVEKVVVIKEMVKARNEEIAPLKITGRITNEKGDGLIGATVMEKGTKNATASDAEGRFELSGVEAKATIVVSSVGYETQEIVIGESREVLVTLKIVVNELDESVVVAYGTTTRRFNTGTVSKVTAEEISKQPVTNPLATLQGRVPGLVITQSSGVSGSAFKVRIRGQNSLRQGSDPFFIVDGVPLATNNGSINVLGSAAGNGAETGLSPLNFINPLDIESIEVLKDADATAIYGSRGANGVILITTKKGIAGKTKVGARVSTGWSKVSRTMELLNTSEYVQLRREALTNDGLPVDEINAPDLTAWDTTRYSDLTKQFIGNTALTHDAQISITGGNSSTQFMISGGYHKGTTVFPTDLGDTRVTTHLNLNHRSFNDRFILGANVDFSSMKNELPVQDMTAATRLPPHIKLRNDDGSVRFEEGGISFYDMLIDNPLSVLERYYDGRFKNLSGNLQLAYRIIPGLQARLNGGYNFLSGDEFNTYPSSSFDPKSGNLPFSYFATSSRNNWIAEPQLEYVKGIGEAKIDVLIGGSFQNNLSKTLETRALNYGSDLLLRSIAGAANVLSSNQQTEYKYEAYFGKINLSWASRYIINLSGRRDGSSRFGPNKRFSNFGAVGAAWILSSEGFLQKIKAVSFAKLRTSYGVTGNDQIGDYKYLDTWAASPNTYNGISSLTPSSLYNSNFSWERNRKIEAAVDLGFFKDKLLVSAGYFRNRSSNQLVSYALPATAGFFSVLRNLDALVENTGFEFQVSSKVYERENFLITIAANLTANRNKLIDFPSLETSTYNGIYVIGESITSTVAYRYLGVNPDNGLVQFEDVNKNNQMDAPDRNDIIRIDPKYYGGVSAGIEYNGFELFVLLEFKKQKGRNFLAAIQPPGSDYQNLPKEVLRRWQNPGDNTDIPKAITYSNPDITPFFALAQSNGVISDASFIRGRNISLAYNFKRKITGQMKIADAQLFVQAQNLFVISKFKGYDPEVQNLFVLPPLKTIVIGAQITL